MKVILSRKGFDSANGGILSPIFEYGTMLSLPIPSKNHDKDNILYSDLVCKGISLNMILENLGYKGDACCHLDPDLDLTRKRNSIDNWQPSFGQINQSSSYLINNGVGKGDLFLFFGNFKHVMEVDGIYKYAHGNKNSADPYYGKSIQVIWGYLQVGKIISDPQEQKKFWWHPHSCLNRIYGEKNNLIYTASEHLSFAPNLPGCGVFDYDEKRVLSMLGKTKATWKPNKAYDVNNIEGNRKNSAKDGEGIYYAGIWQELVLKENETSEKWAKEMF